MTPEHVINLVQNALLILILIASPLLAVSLGVGLLVSVFQAATQINEMTLTFIPKVVCMFLALLMALPWLMERMITFTRDVFINIPTYIR